MFGAFDPYFCIECAKVGRLQTVATEVDENKNVTKVCPNCGTVYPIMDAFRRDDILYILWIAVAMMQEEDSSVVPEAVRLWLKIQGKEKTDG